MSADIRLLETERERDAAALTADFLRCAGEIAEHRKGDIAGFVIVAWSPSNDVTVMTKIWDHARLPRQLVPEFIKETVLQDILMRNVLNAMADAEGSGGAA